jgi:tRNA A37 methylthiotransferase MiaB
MASFSVRFLGCKVSYADAQAVRERLLGDGHVEAADAADVAVVNTCCVTHEAISKSRQAVSRAARSHGASTSTGCGANLDGAFDAAAAERHDRARTERGAPDRRRGHVGAIACVRPMPRSSGRARS